MTTFSVITTIFLIMMACGGEDDNNPAMVNLELSASISRTGYSERMNALGTVNDIQDVRISVEKVSDGTIVIPETDMTETSTDIWEIMLTDLPIDVSLKFTCQAHNSESVAIFNGEVTQTLTPGGDNDIDIGMRSIDDGVQPNNPKILSATIPEEIEVDATSDIVFTISHTGVVGYTIEVLYGTLDGTSDRVVSGSCDSANDLVVTYYASATSGQDSIALKVSDPGLADVIGATFPINVVDRVVTSNISVLFGPIIEGMKFRRTSSSLELELQTDPTSDLTYSWSGSDSFSGLTGTTNPITLNAFSESDSGDVSADVVDVNGLRASISRTIDGTDFPYYIRAAAPSELIVKMASVTKMILSWSDNSYNENGFTIERDTSSDFGSAAQFVVGSNVTTFLDEDLTSDVNYYYRVKANNGGIGDSDWSDTFVESINPNGIQLQVDFVDGGAGGGNKIYVIWIDKSSDSFYQNLFVCNHVNSQDLTGTLIPFWEVNKRSQFSQSDIDAVSGATQLSDFSVSNYLNNGDMTEFTLYFEVDHSNDRNDWFEDQPSIVYAVDIDLKDLTDGYSLSHAGWSVTDGVSNPLYGTYAEGDFQSETRHITHHRDASGDFGSLYVDDDPQTITPATNMVGSISLTLIR